VTYALRSSGHETERGLPGVSLSSEIAARQILDTLLATKMRLELATGVPVGIYGPLGQLLPGISPAQSRQIDSLLPAPPDLLPQHNWPARRGQLVEVTHGTNLHFFLTPLVFGDRPIAQVVLGPIHIFGPGDNAQPRPTSQAAGAPTLPSWQAQAIAEIACTLVSHLAPLAPTPSTRGSRREEVPEISNQATAIMPIVNNAARYTGEHRAHLGSLAEDASLAAKSMPYHPGSWPAPPVGDDVVPTARDEQTALLAALITHMPQAVIVSAAPDGQIVLANPAARKLWPSLLGEPEAGAPRPGSLTSDRYPAAWAGLNLALRQEASLFRSEVSIDVARTPLPTSVTPGSGPLPAQQTTAHGANQVTLLVSAFPLRNAQGLTTYAVALFEELSGLIERERFKDEFLLVAAHEMRNPLTVISSYAQLLERHLAMASQTEQGMERTRSRLHEIQEQVQLLTDLSSQLSIVTRLLSAQQRPRRETINLSRLIQRVAIDQQLLAPGRTIESVVEHDPCLVQADPEQLHQILLHLLKNAIRYSRPEKPIRLALRCTPENAPLWAEISVRDQGIGIPRTSLPHLFERFYRVNETGQRALAAGLPRPSDEQVSLGLGLYLSKQLIDAMGGRIWVDSAEGLGTTVTFTVPLKR
jgi:signal transduction histidine kinase